MSVETAILPWSRVDNRGGSTSDAFLLDRACPICGAHDDILVQEQPHYQFFTDADTPKRMTLRDVKCQQCFALYKNPTYSPEAMRVLFAEAGRSYGSGRQAAAQVDWLEALGVLRGRSSVLDVGCGSGRFLSQMPSSWNRMGIEPDEGLAQQVRDNGLSCFTAPVEAIRPSCTVVLGLITMWHVLEHVPDPVNTLKQLRNLASDQTRLVVEVPVVERGATPDITGFLTPQHTTHFSRWTLFRALEQAGWTVDRAEFVNGHNGFRAIANPRRLGTVLTQFANQDPTHLATYLQAQSDYRELISLRTLFVDSPLCVIWGAGFHTESLYQRTHLFMNQRSFLLVDSDPAKQGQTWRGIPIGSPADVLPSVDWAETKLLISSYGDQQEIKAAALQMGVPAGRIVTLYEPEEIRSY